MERKRSAEIVQLRSKPSRKSFAQVAATKITSNELAVESGIQRQRGRGIDDASTRQRPDLEKGMDWVVGPPRYEVRTTPRKVIKRKVVVDTGSASE